MTSRVDVIIPCYNYAAFLPDCVASVLAQNVPLRILIIDDASQDETWAVASRLAAGDKRITIRRHARNQGHLATYAEGYEWAESDYTLLLSADDLLTPDALARAVAVLDAQPDTAFVYGRVVRFRSGEPLPTVNVSGVSEAAQVVAGTDWIEKICRDPSESITSPEAVLRTSLLKQLGGMRTDLPHTGDQEMWLRYAAHGSVGILDSDQAYYRLHGRSMQAQNYGTALADLTHWRRAFDLFFAAHETCLREQNADPERLRRTADAGLAHLALWHVYNAFYEQAEGEPLRDEQGRLRPADCVDEAACRELIRFAVSLVPNVRRQRLYWQVQAMLRIGPQGWAHWRIAFPKSRADNEARRTVRHEQHDFV